MCNAAIDLLHHILYHKYYIAELYLAGGYKRKEETPNGIGNPKK